MAEKAGEIYYDIEADVSGLIQAQQQVNKRLDQMDAKFEQSSRSAGRFEGALNKVGVAIAAAFTIDAAKKLFRTKGYKNTSVDEISDEAVLSKGTFYQYFKSKEN